MDNSNINTLWTQGLKQEDKENLKRLLLANSDNKALVLLKQIISKKRSILENSERTIDNYLDNNWVYRQAHYNGMRQAYKLCEDLLAFVK